MLFAYIICQASSSIDFYAQVHASDNRPETTVNSTNVTVNSAIYNYIIQYYVILLIIAIGLYWETMLKETASKDINFKRWTNIPRGLWNIVNWDWTWASSRPLLYHVQWQELRRDDFTMYMLCCRNASVAWKWACNAPFSANGLHEAWPPTVL